MKKMSSIFKLPLRVALHEQYGNVSSEIIQSGKDKIILNPQTIITNKKELQAIVHAVNSHDEAMKLLNDIYDDCECESFDYCERCETIRQFLSAHNDSEEPE